MISKRKGYSGRQGGRQTLLLTLFKFPLGAAVLAKDKKVYLGTNVENVLFGLKICAERSALCNAISSGAKDFEALAVYSSRGDISP
jgi:cytidine deaminase